MSGGRDVREPLPGTEGRDASSQHRRDPPTTRTELGQGAPPFDDGIRCNFERLPLQRKRSKRGLLSGQPRTLD
jgi:hypothetical protein